VTRARRAEAFHALVEDSSAGGVRLPGHPERPEHAEYGTLLAVVGALRAVPDPVADPAFVAALRDRLIAEAETVLVAAAAQLEDADARLRLRPTTPHAKRRQRRLAAVVSGFALVGVTTTVAVASQNALPGDGLYSVKRGLESAHAELTFNRADRGRVLLDSARTRLDEAQTLSRDQADPARVTDALNAFTDQAIAGSDLLVSDYQATGDRSSITTLRTFSVASMDQLDQLQSSVPAQSLDSLLDAAQVVDQVQQTSVQACSVCDGPVLGSVPSVLAQTTQATLDAWQVAVPKPRHALTQGADGGPVLPHLKGQLPPASVTDPGDSTADPTDQTPSAPTADDVQNTVQHLTDGLTDNHQNDVASTIADTTTNLLDAVGQVGNTVAQTVDGTVGGLIGGLLGSPSP
jgi:hypothetical protein